VRLDGWLFAVCAAQTCMTSVFMTCAWGLAPDRARAARTAATRVDAPKI
jgi:hypothetical protein